MPYALKKEMDKEVSEMMKTGIIESSVSEYASSPIVVRKPDRARMHVGLIATLSAVIFYPVDKYKKWYACRPDSTIHGA